MRILNFFIGIKASISQNNFHRLDRLRKGGARAIIIRWGVDQYTAPYRYTAMPLLLEKNSVELAESCRSPSQNLVVWDFSEPQRWICSLEWEQPQRNAQWPELKSDHRGEFVCGWLRQWQPLFKMGFEKHFPRTHKVLTLPRISTRVWRLKTSS
jgi:hypothetical protein